MQNLGQDLETCVLKSINTQIKTFPVPRMLQNSLFFRHKLYLEATVSNNILQFNCFLSILCCAAAVLLPWSWLLI